ncbi:hypothetical protein LQ327_28570 [Actinomycetospora endophytica]|uniref:Uncharacterized protein n=1 Tax=Actinomycetospora endophytica TaxID=2291215 RepID=A0ABS8PK18_9PSEU|nr:hypothetical protein [Actinomycetospora endophytica]MCD2197334.1 hypothetical protein [Actinomycetospora endophytica]
MTHRDKPLADSAQAQWLMLAELDANDGFPLSTDQLADRLWERFGIEPRVAADALWHLSIQGVIGLARWPGPRPRHSRPHWVIVPSAWAE